MVENPELKADYTCSDPQTQVDGYQLCFIVLRWVLSNICLFISDNMTFRLLSLSMYTLLEVINIETLSIVISSISVSGSICNEF